MKINGQKAIAKADFYKEALKEIRHYLKQFTVNTDEFHQRIIHFIDETLKGNQSSPYSESEG